MNGKDTINKITGIIAVVTFSIIALGLIIENKSILGFPNALMLYLLLPSALIWFGTRKNGCGSCNQTCSSLEQDKNNN